MGVLQENLGHPASQEECNYKLAVPEVSNDSTCISAGKLNQSVGHAQEERNVGGLHRIHYIILNAPQHSVCDIGRRRSIQYVIVGGFTAFCMSCFGACIATLDLQMTV